MAKRKKTTIPILRIRKGDTLKTIHAKARRAFTAADLQKYTEIENGIPVRQVLAELEALDLEATRKQRRNPRKDHTRFTPRGWPMTLQLTLSPELEERLRQEAERRRQPTETVALQLLEEHLPPPMDERRAAAIAMLHRWMEEDAALSPEESAANLEVLRAIDEDRPSYRKLFTDILKDEPK